jgi:hypothetical protein
LPDGAPASLNGVAAAAMKIAQAGIDMQRAGTESCSQGMPPSVSSGDMGPSMAGMSSESTPPGDPPAVAE